MKQFLKNILSTVIGVLLVGLVGAIFTVVVVLAVVASQSIPPKVSSGSVLRIKLEGAVSEQVTENSLDVLLGESQCGVALNELRLALDEAKTNKNILGVYIEAGILQASPADLQAIREALLDFKKSTKKFIVAYGDIYSQGSYYVSSVADKVVLNPIGAIEWRGLSAEPMFLKDMLGKVGVKMHVFKVGSYKSAVEPFTSTEMSPANREQVGSYLGSIWKNVVNEVSKSRKIKPDSLQLYADRYMALAPPQSFVDLKMADTLLYSDGITALIKGLCKTVNEVPMISPSDLVAASAPSSETKEIAVYYAYGDVVSTEMENISNSTTLCAESMVKKLQSLAKDDDVKAVVIRINSGGGSAYASEQIWRAVSLLKEKKPVVVSMGGMAASGAYYVAAPATTIIAQPTTLTGSVGIFGMFPDASELLNDKLGIHFDNVKTNRHSDFGTMSRPLNAEEQRLLQVYIERGYKLFLERVAKGRNKSLAAVDSIAQGRVWTGEQALKIGLVDKLGGLPFAIEHAAKLAKMAPGSYSVKEYPVAKPWYETLPFVTSGSYFDNKMRSTLGDYYAPLSTLTNLKKQDYIQARLPYYITIR